MSTRPLHLMCYRNSPSQRAHFAIFVPSATDASIGTVINVVGAPMVGFVLEFKRNYALKEEQQPYVLVSIGEIDTKYIADSETSNTSADCVPRGVLEIIASQIVPPRISQNFLAPVNDTTNRRCQEWTMDFVQRLVQLNYLDESAIKVVQSKRDSPSHGIGLQPIELGKNHRV